MNGIIMAYREEGTFEAVAEGFGGEEHLWAFLRAERAGNQSYEAIAYLLTRKGHRVGASTVRRWILRNEALQS